MEEEVINREMLADSRKEELKRWHEFKVAREVPLAEMIRFNLRPLPTNWVDVWKNTSRGVKKMK